MPNQQHQQQFDNPFALPRQLITPMNSTPKHISKNKCTSHQQYNNNYHNQGNNTKKEMQPTMQRLPMHKQYALIYIGYSLLILNQRLSNGQPLWPLIWIII